MIGHAKAFFATALALIASGALTASVLAQAPDAPPSQTAARIGPCVNMANMLEAPHEGDWGRPIADNDFGVIAAAGFKTIRLPVAFGAHAATTSPYSIDGVFQARVHHVVDLAVAAHLGVILDLQNDDRLYSNPAAEAPRLAGMWRQIGASYQDAPPSVWFELTNEPHDRLTNGNLLQTLAPALAAVRATNPSRKVVIGGADYSSIGSLATLQLPDDPNLIATFHYYDPFAFTHQGATWISPSPPLGATFGSPADLTRLQQDVGKARAYMARTDRPLILGEYGAFDRTIPTEQRAAYYKAVHDAFARAGIGGCVWGYTDSFKIREGDHWIEPILRAIGL